MKGLEIHALDNGFQQVRVHYTADPAKDTPAWVAKAKAGMPRWAWQREYEIDFGARGGRLIYDMWDAEVHEVVLGSVPETWTRYRGLDHGLANPTAVIWGAVDTENNVWIYREYYQSERTISENCQQILACQGEKERIRFTYADPSLLARDPRGGKALADEYAECGVSLTPADHRMEIGVNTVCSYLISGLAKWSRKNGKPHGYFEGWDAAKIDALANQPAVYFGGACPNVIREMKGLRWREIVGNPQDHNLKEQPVDKDDHAADAVRYLLMAEPRYREAGKAVEYHRKSMMKGGRVAW